MMPYIDTHTHIYTEEFAEDVHAVIARAVAAGAEKLLLPNIDETSIQQMLSLCAEYPNLCLPMMGLHPTELPPNPQPLLQRMEDILEQQTQKFIAIGEVGIDLYWDDTRREEQIKVFHQQIEWADHYNLPLMIHTRAAHRDLVYTLRPFRNRVSGVFHCFGGTADEAHELLSTFPTFVLGIGGIVTFKKSQLPTVLRNEVPLHRIVLETDAPYLAPTPHRGKRNEPSYIPLVVEKLAEIYEVSAQEISDTTLRTTKKMFSLCD